MRAISRQPTEQEWALVVAHSGIVDAIVNDLHLPTLSAERAYDNGFIALIRAALQYDQRGPFKTFAWPVVRNAVRDAMRADRRERVRGIVPLRLLATIAANPPVKTAIEQVTEVWDRLSSADRVLLRLRFWEKQTCSAIGKLLGCGRRTASLRIATALWQCRILLEPRWWCAQPVRVAKQEGKWRIVDAKSLRIAIGPEGSSADGGGHRTLNAAEAHARAINSCTGKKR